MKNSMKEMSSKLLSKLEAIYLKVFAKTGLSLSDLGDADDESALLIRDGLKLYAETKEYVSVYAELVDKQAEQIDKLVDLASKQQKQLEELGSKLDKLAAKSTTKKAVEA